MSGYGPMLLANKGEHVRAFVCVCLCVRVCVNNAC